MCAFVVGHILCSVLVNFYLIKIIDYKYEPTFSFATTFSGNFQETFVETEIVSDAVLPVFLISLIVWEFLQINGASVFKKA